MSDIVHFENLWDRAEKAAKSETIVESEVLGKALSNLEEIRDIYKTAASSKDKPLVQGMKSKALGRLLINIAALSAKENIDVYAALKDQLDILKLKEKFIF